MRVIVVLLLLPLAGCLGSNSDACIVDVPLLRLDEFAAYEGYGTFSVPTRGVLVTAPPAGNGNQLVDLGQGSVTVSVEPHGPAVGLDGTLSDSVAIEYTWHREPSVLVATEFVDQETGHVAQFQFHESRRLGERLEQWTMFGLPVHPAGLWATYVAGESLQKGWTRTVEAPGSLYHAYPPVTTTVNFEAKVIETHEQDGACVAVVETTAIRPILGSAPTVWRVTWNSDSALPLSIESIKPSNFEATRIEHRPGTAIATQAFDPVFPESHMPRAALVDGAPPYRDSSFDFSFGDALTEIKNDASHQDWMTANPDAELVEFFHFKGSDDGPTVGQWILAWVAKAGTSAWGVTQMRDPLIIQRERQVLETGFDPTPGWPVVDAAPTLGTMEQAAKAFLGEDVEYVHCKLQTAACRLGTHEGTGAPRADGGTGTQAIGFSIDLQRGIVLQDAHWK